MNKNLNKEKELNKNFNKDKYNFNLKKNFKYISKNKNNFYFEKSKTNINMFTSKNYFYNNKNNYKKKGIGLYKTFDIYNDQLNYLIDKYKKLKDSISNFNLIIKKINEKIINYDNKSLIGTIKYKFKGKLHTDDFFYLFKKREKDKKLFNIFKLNNLMLKEAFSKLNRHGKAFKYIYDMIYRKILKYPYLITIKPKTIIILEYKNLIQYIFE